MKDIIKQTTRVHIKKKHKDEHCSVLEINCLFDTKSKVREKSIKAEQKDRKTRGKKLVVNMLVITVSTNVTKSVHEIT